MSTGWELHLERWQAAGVVDVESAARIRAWEHARATPNGLRWPVLLAIACGALLLCAGVLLFVAAHWDRLSPAGRMSIVVVLTGMFHVGGALASRRFEIISGALHTVGSVSLGAGIAVTGQTFHLSAHWPQAILLWAVGAFLGWLILRQWPQAGLTAVLVPGWLVAEWSAQYPRAVSEVQVMTGLCALAFVYLSARRALSEGAVRKVLGWIGSIAILPVAGLTAVVAAGRHTHHEDVIGWTIAAGVPLALALWLGRKEAWRPAIAVAWTFLLALIGPDQEVLVYAWCGLGGIALAAWGIFEARAERVNLGIAGFAISVFAFYFSNVMDKLDRSLSLAGLGLLFLGGGWLMERTRRQLIGRIRVEGI